MPLRIAVLGGFRPSQARPQQAPLDGAALVVAMASVAELAALDHQQAPIVGAALVALRVAALRGFGPSQARPLQAPVDGTCLMALAGGSHQLALWGTTLATSVPLGY